MVIAWIEDAATSATSGDSGVRIAVLDERGTLAGAPQLIRGEEKSTISSVALTCSAMRCRVVTASAIRESMQLDAFDLSPGAPPGPRKTLMTLTGSGNGDVSPSFAGPSANQLFFGDDAGSDKGRVRFMTIAWPGAK